MFGFVILKASKYEELTAKAAQAEAATAGLAFLSRLLEKHGVSIEIVESLKRRIEEQEVELKSLRECAQALHNYQANAGECPSLSLGWLNTSGYTQPQVPSQLGPALRNLGMTGGNR